MPHEQGQRTKGEAPRPEVDRAGEAMKKCVACCAQYPETLEHYGWNETLKRFKTKCRRCTMPRMTVRPKYRIPKTREHTDPIGDT